MSERLLYAKNGRITIDNIDRIPLGTIAGIDGWFLQMVTDTEDDQDVIYLSISNRNKPKLVARFFTCILTKNGESDFDDREFKHLKSNKRYFGETIPVETLLDVEKGYLNDDGELSIEYGIQVELIQGEDGIWKFNFFDTLLNCQKLRNMISFMKENRGELKYLHCHKQLLKFHSNRFGSKFKKNNLIEMPSEIDYKTLEQCLQIAHGVRLQLSVSDIADVIFAAHNFGLQNVVHYCEQQLIENGFNLLTNTRYVFALIFELNCYLAHLMKNLKSTKKLKGMLKDEDIQMMSGEIMKKCAKFFFKKKSK